MRAHSALGHKAGRLKMIEGEGDLQHREPERDFLREYLAQAPLALALLRAIECRELAAFEFKRPILDLGCGDGLLGQILFAQAPDVGLDRAQRELRVALARGAYRALVCADIAAMPFADQRFATILANGVLEHVGDLRAGLAEIARLLAPGGQLIFSVPTPQSECQLSGALLLRRLGLAKLARRYADLYNRVFGQIHVYTWAAWCTLLTDCGLEMVSHRAYAPATVFCLHDLALPFSLPGYLCKRLTGRWSLVTRLRRKALAPFWRRLLRRVYDDRASPGCSLLMVARQASTA